MEQQLTLNQILEKVRILLYDLQKEYGLSHPVVIQQSIVLDELINLAQYHKKRTY